MQCIEGVISKLRPEIIEKTMSNMQARVEEQLFS